jgi:hypothetical protein
MGKVEELLKELSPELQREVEDFAAFLVEKQGKKNKSAPSLEWAGAVQDLKERYTSVDLQHTIAEWRIGGQ